MVLKVPRLSINKLFFVLGAFNSYRDRVHDRPVQGGEQSRVTADVRLRHCIEFQLVAEDAMFMFGR